MRSFKKGGNVSPDQQALRDLNLFLVKALRKFRVLVKVRPEQLDHTNGAILVYCPDCDQSEDILKYHFEICKKHRSTPRIHPLSLNGGALLIPEESPLNQKLREDAVFIAHMKDAKEMKRIETFILLYHGPYCGAAFKFGLNFLQMTDLAVKAQERIKLVFGKENHNIALVCQADFNERKRTYFVSHENWQTWCRIFGPSHAYPGTIKAIKTRYPELL